ASRRLDGFHNRWFLDAVLRGTYPADMAALYERRVGPLDFVHAGDLELVAQPIDFLGVNFYCPTAVAASGDGSGLGLREGEAGLERTAMGWPVDPSALTELLVRLRDEYGDMPLLITENGAAYDDWLDDGLVADDRRVAYLAGHVDAVERARAAGV